MFYQLLYLLLPYNNHQCQSDTLINSYISYFSCHLTPYQQGQRPRKKPKSRPLRAIVLVFCTQETNLPVVVLNVSNQQPFQVHSMKFPPSIASPLLCCFLLDRSQIKSNVTSGMQSHWLHDTN